MKIPDFPFRLAILTARPLAKVKLAHGSSRERVCWCPCVCACVCEQKKKWPRREEEEEEEQQLEE